MNQIFAIFLIVMVIAFGAFFVASGKLGTLSFGKIDFGVPLQNLGQDPIIRYRGPGAGTASGTTESRTQTGSGSGLQVSVGTGTATPVTVKLPPMPAGSPSPRFSEYYGRIKLGTVNHTQLSLRAVFTSGEKIDVTGWYLKANHGGWFVPQAVNIYEPNGLATPTDIFLGRGETLSMYSGVSPVGTNFRLNLCTGYLNNDRKFVPTLPRQCPGADTATLRNFSSQCQDYVPSAVSGCKVPKSVPPVPYYDDGCRNYLKNFTFQGCFNLYRSEPNFLSKEWRAWMGTTFVDARHDRVFLLDKNGFVVDWKEF